MKRKITLLFAAALGIFSASAQIVLNESFTATWSPSAAGWTIQNNSVPTGTNTWFQGSSATFSSNSGGPNDYYAVNYNSQGSTAGGISNFLITPTVNLTNGGVIQFATRTVTSTTVYPDRLQLLMSQGTGTGAIGTGTTAVGSFTTTLVTVNPNLTTTGYPTTWTIYTATLSGITGTVAGRFAFRYWVDAGGPNGANSDYIGIDDVKYSLPCASPTISISASSAGICSGNSVVLSGSGATSYTWNTGATTSSVSVSPNATAIYTLTGSSTPGCNGTNTVAVTVTLTPNLSVSNVTTCPGTPVLLSASGASAYSWNTGATTSTITNSGTADTYTVTGVNGTCSDTKTVSVSLGSGLSLGVVSTSSAICAGSSATLTATGPATSYTWLPSGTGASIVVNPTTGTTYTVAGSNGACFGANTISIAVNPVPNVSITLSTASNTVCANQGTINVTASGASTYTWSPFASNAPVVTVNTPTNPGTYALGVTGTSSLGCTKNYTTTLVVSLCTGIANNSIESNSAVVYPNPFTSELTVSGVSGAIEVINALGQVVLTTTISESQTINTSSFAKGVYFIKVKNTDSKGTQTIKVIKN